MSLSSAVYSARGAISVTPNDNTTLAPFRGVMVGTAGNVAMRFADGSTVTVPGLTPGNIYPLQGDRILSTGTGATGIVVLL